MKRSLSFMSAAALTASLALLPAIAGAQITPGTDLVGNMDQSLSSNHAQVGQRFTMSNVHSQNNNIHDATLYGHVVSVQAAGQGTPGKIELAVDKVRTSTGNSYAVDGRATQVQTNTKSNATKEVAGAVGGMIVGNILGKMVGTNLGGALGAGGGYVLAKNNKENIEIPPNAVVTFQVLKAYKQKR